MRVSKTKFFVDVYNHEITVALHEDLETSARAALTDKYVDEYVLEKHGKDYFEQTRAMYIASDDVHAVLLRPQSTIPQMVHEAFHAVEHMAHDKGFPHSEETSEPWAYLVGYVAGETIEAFKRLTK